MAQDKKPQSEASKFLTVLVIFGVLGALCFGGGGDNSSSPTTSPLATERYGTSAALQGSAEAVVDAMSVTARGHFCQGLADTYRSTNGDADLTFDLTFEAFKAGYTRSSPPAFSVYEELGSRC